MSKKEPHSIAELFSSLFKEMKGECVSIADVFEAFGSRSYGPFLFTLSLLAISPLGIIPGLPSLLSLLIILISVQYFFQKGRPWIPKFILDKKMNAKDAKKKLGKVEPYLKKLDHFIKPRLNFLTNTLVEHLIIIVIIVLAVTMIPLEAVPWGVMAPGLAILILSLGIVGRDGLVMLIGLILSLSALTLTAYLLIS